MQNAKVQKYKMSCTYYQTSITLSFNDAHKAINVLTTVPSTSFPLITRTDEKVHMTFMSLEPQKVLSLLSPYNPIQESPNEPYAHEMATLQPACPNCGWVFTNSNCMRCRVVETQD